MTFGGSNDFKIIAKLLKNSHQLTRLFSGDCEKILSQIKCEIDELPTPYKYDVLNYNSIENINLVDHINRVGKLFYKKDT